MPAVGSVYRALAATHRFLAPPSIGVMGLGFPLSFKKWDPFCARFLSSSVRKQTLQPLRRQVGIPPGVGKQAVTGRKILTGDPGIFRGVTGPPFFMQRSCRCALGGWRRTGMVFCLEARSAPGGFFRTGTSKRLALKIAGPLFGFSMSDKFSDCEVGIHRNGQRSLLLSSLQFG